MLNFKPLKTNQIGRQALTHRRAVIKTAIILCLALTASFLMTLPSSRCWARPTAIQNAFVTDVKAESVAHLRELRSQNLKRLNEIDDTLAKKIEDLPAQDWEQNISDLKATRQEHALRQELLDRLIFQFDSKFSGSDVKTFLERTLLDMAKIDIASQNSSGLWKFLKYAADAIKNLPERKENTLAFFEGYMNHSVSHPVRPEDYMSSRNYTNGSRSEQGSPMSRDEVGDLADQRLRQLSAPSIRVRALR